MLISRRREAKRRALLQMLDRIPIRTLAKQPAARLTPPVEVAVAPSAAPQGLPRIKQ